MSAYPESGARPDALALNAAYKAVRVSWEEAFAGDPQEVAGRFTAWVQAASALSRNLAAEQHRAPVFRQTLDTFTGSATRLASRTQATAQDPAAWARVFAAACRRAGYRPRPGNRNRTPPAGRSSPDHDVPRQKTSRPASTAARTTSGKSRRRRPAPTDTEPALPDACRSAADLRRLAAACLDTGTGRRPRGAELTVVHDKGRTVLLHDDISGTSAGGYRLDPGEVPAYLAAYAPPAAPAPLPGRPRPPRPRRGGRPDPGRRPGDRRPPQPRSPHPPRGGPGVHHLLRARHHRAARAELPRRDRQRPPRAKRRPGGSDRQLPVHLPPQRPGCHVRGPGRGAAGLGAQGRPAHPAPGRRGRLLHPRRPRPPAHGARRRPRRRHRRGRQLLAQAEALTLPLTPFPEREAELIAVITQHTARYGYTDDPAGYMARAVPPLLDASDREWDWVRSYISAHPEVREHPAQDEAAAQAGQPDDGRQQAAGKSRQAKAALDSGDFEQALALLDEAELLYPEHGISYGAARDQVRSAMDQAGPGHPQDQDSPAAAAASRRHRLAGNRSRPRPRPGSGQMLGCLRRGGCGTAAARRRDRRASGPANRESRPWRACAR